jgi:glycosyltransferase involved in cell wall biosynthesis
MHLVVVTPVIHFEHEGNLWAYAPYVREMDIWAEFFDKITIAAPCRNEIPPGDCAMFKPGNVTIRPQRQIGGTSLRAKLSYAWWLPWMIWRLALTLRTADAIHVRCPGNLALLGVLLGPLFSSRLVAKYAGQWQDFPGEPPTIRFQRKLLASRWWHGPVTVYGNWPNQPAHVIPFFSSATPQQEMDRGRQWSLTRTFRGTLRVVFIGRLSKEKNVDVVLKAGAKARDLGSRLEFTIIGHGPQRDHLETLARELGISVRFTGGVDHGRVLRELESADILTLVSQTEGWPKAIVEAMSFGLVCIGSDRGLIPHMLGEGRGRVVPPGDADALAKVFVEIERNREAALAISGAAAEWAGQFSIERLGGALRDLLESRWQCRLRPPRPAPAIKMAAAAAQAQSGR